MPADRPHDVSSLTAAQLERAKRDLEISLALAFPGSPVRVSIHGRDDRHRRGASRARRRPMIYRCSCRWSMVAHAPNASPQAASRSTLPSDAPVTAGRRYGTA